MLKYLLILFMVLVSGCTSQPKFKVGDQVIISYGFYEGCKMTIDAYYDVSLLPIHNMKYRGMLQCATKTGLYIDWHFTVKKNELEETGVNL